MTDRAGRFVRFKLKPGNAAESTELEPLLSDVPLTKTKELLGDKAYDTNAIREFLASAEIIATIPSKSNRKLDIPYNKESYKARHLVENTFLDAKQFRGIATRYCKLRIMFEGLLELVAWFLSTKEAQRGISPYHSSSNSTQ